MHRIALHELDVSLPVVHGCLGGGHQGLLGLAPLIAVS
jgi:hypothetical protein